MAAIFHHRSDHRCQAHVEEILGRRNGVLWPSFGDLDGSLHSGVLPRARPGHWAGKSGRLFDRAVPYRDATPDLLLGVPTATCQEGGFPVVDADAAHVDRGVVAHATLGYGYTPKKKLGHALDGM